MSQQPDLLAAWTAASQACRDRAQIVGILTCHDDPEWCRLEQVANQAYDAARAAGHTYAELAEAERTA